MQFIDLPAQQNRIREKIDENIQTVLSHGKYIMGPEIGELETQLSQYAGCRHGVGCASGTDALLLALMAYEVGPGDAIFTSPFTFIATAEVIQLLGATPVFVDIDPATFNIDPAKLESALQTLRSNDSSAHPLPKRAAGEGQKRIAPKGVVPVDLFGLPADYDRILRIARSYGMFVIGDAAQSFGATCQGRKAGSIADIACTSFFPAKPLGCYGDGGMCFTDDDTLAEAMRSIRIHGKGTHKYDNMRTGINARLDTLQAAILLAKFSIFPEEVELRDKAANRYTELLSSASAVQAPVIPEGYTSVWAQYSLLARDENHRTRLQEALKNEGVPTAIYYPKPLHLQTAFKHLGYGEGDFPVSEDYSQRIFSIPMHPYLGEGDQEKITKIIMDIE